MITFFVWFILCLCVGLVAHSHKERGFFVWFILSMFISPVLSFLILLAIGNGVDLDEQRKKSKLMKEVFINKYIEMSSKGKEFPKSISELFNKAVSGDEIAYKEIKDGLDILDYI